VRRITTLAVALVAAVAMTTTTAQASVFDADGDPCPQVQVSGNTVTGGCLVENYEGTWEVNPGGYTVTECPLTFDLRVSTDAFYYDFQTKVYAVNFLSGVCTGIQRRPCTDPATGATIPWSGAASFGAPFFLENHGIALNMCVESPGNPGYGATERVSFNAQQDNDGYLLDLANGHSDNLVGEFDNVDHGEGREMRIQYVSPW
jgi:hypothetical protein